jgi:hypothetical protein
MVGPADPEAGEPPTRVAHASLIHSERDILRFWHSRSTLSVSLSSIVTEYRTIQIHFVVHLLHFSIGCCTI